jgi:hypothetical protein
MPETIRVEFEQLAQPPFSDLPIRVSVSGRFTRRGGARFAASVGRQALEAISFDPEGTGFVGYIHARPNVGDELVLRRGMFTVATGARFDAPASAHGLEGDAALVASVPPARSRTLGVDVPRGTERFDPQGARVPATSLARSWIIEEPTLTPDARAFKPATRDKTCRVTLAVRVPRLPAGGSIRWSVPPANRGAITLSGDPRVVSHTQTGPRVDVIGLVPGLTFLDVEARDASGRTLESIKFPICVPQFVQIFDSPVVSQPVLTRFNLGGEKDQVYAVAKEVCDRVLASANVRMVWSMPPAFRETLPPQFASGGIAAARVTTVTILGEPPEPGLLGSTPRPNGPAVFNELIDIFPGAYDEPNTGTAFEEVDDMTIAAVQSIAHLANMSSQQKDRVIQLIGRLIGETIAHEIGHSIIGPTLAGPTGGHNPPAGSPGALLHSLMNEGRDRSLFDRTGFRAVASPISLDNAVDDGIGAINVPTGRARAQIDAHLPVPPVFV